MKKNTSTPELSELFSTALASRGITHTQVSELFARRGPDFVRILVDLVAEDVIQLAGIQRKQFPVTVDYRADRAFVVRSVGFDVVLSMVDSLGCSVTDGHPKDMYSLQSLGRGKKEIQLETFPFDQRMSMSEVWQMYRDLDLRPAVLHEMCALASRYPKEDSLATLGTYSECGNPLADPMPAPSILGMACRADRRIIAWLDTQGDFGPDWRFVGVPGWIEPKTSPFDSVDWEKKFTDRKS